MLVNLKVAYERLCNDLDMVVESEADHNSTRYTTKTSWQRGPMGKAVVFMVTLITLTGFNPRPGHVVASLNKTFYDDYIFAW